MTSPVFYSRRLFSVLSLGSIYVLVRGSEPAANDAPMMMNPFSISAAGDVGYLAHSSLSGSRLNSNLGDLAVPTTAFTQEFLDDVALRSTDELAAYMPSTDIVYQEASQSNFTNDGATLQVRGLPATNTVNFFPASLRMDLYNTTRVDQSRGPNSILFGFGSPGGVVNISPNRATLDRAFGSLIVQPRSANGLRSAIDYNLPLMKDRLSLRVDAVRDHGGTWRDHEYDHQDRFSLAAQLQVTSKTTLHAQFEYGKVDKSNGTPAGWLDGYTIWANAGRRISATPVAAQGIVTLGTVNYIAIDTATGQAWDWRGKVRSQPQPVVPGVGVVPYPTDFSIVPKTASFAAGPAFPQITHYRRGSVFLSHAFTPNLNVELAANGYDAPRTAINAQAMNQLWADPNPTLPNGQPNPNAGKAYVEGMIQRQTSIDRSESFRATASYTHDFGGFLGRQTVAGLLETDWSRKANLSERLYDVQNPYSLASPENNANLIRFRTYVDLAGDPANITSGDWRRIDVNQLVDPVSQRKIGAAFVNFAPGSNDNSYRLNSGMAVLQSNWWKNRLVTVVGIREDRQNAWYSPAGDRGPATNGFVLGPYVVVRGRTPKLDKGDTSTLSALFRATKWLGITYNRSNSLSVAPDGYTAIGRAPNPIGRGQDVGFKVDIGQKMNVSATYFETSDNKGFKAVTGNFPEQLFKDIWIGLAGAKIPAPDGTTALSNVPVVGGYTFNAVTKGYEIEVIANPTGHWRVYFNGSYAKSVNSNLGVESLQYFEKYRSFWQQNGRLLLDGSGLAAVEDDGSGIVDTVGKAIKSLSQQFTSTYVLANGQRPRGSIPWRFAARTSYGFRGYLSGLSVGGGVRYQSGQVTDFEPATATTPALVQYGRNNALVDFNTGYKIPARWLHTEAFRVSLQLNINNLLDRTVILPLRVSPTGMIVNYRFQTPRQFVFTTRVSF